MFTVLTKNFSFDIGNVLQNRVERVNSNLVKQMY